MQKRCNYYQVYEDGKLIAEGFKSDLSYMLDISESGIDTAERSKHKVKGKYSIKYVGKRIKRYEKKDQTRIVPPKETFVERYWSLDYYGTTEMSEEEFARHRDLIENKGYRVKYTKIKRGKEKPYYFLEVIS